MQTERVGQHEEEHQEPEPEDHLHRGCRATEPAGPALDPAFRDARAHVPSPLGEAADPAAVEAMVLEETRHQAEAREHQEHRHRCEGPRDSQEEQGKHARQPGEDRRDPEERVAQQALIRLGRVVQLQGVVGQNRVEFRVTTRGRRHELGGRLLPRWHGWQQRRRRRVRLHGGLHPSGPAPVQTRNVSRPARRPREWKPATWPTG